MYLNKELVGDLKYITIIKWLVSQFVENLRNLWNLSGREKAGFYLKAETSLLVNVAANG